MERLIFSYKCLCEFPSLLKFLPSVVLTCLAFKELHYREFEVVYGHFMYLFIFVLLLVSSDFTLCLSASHNRFLLSSHC